jgi:hypothetical protein
MKDLLASRRAVALVTALVVALACGGAALAVGGSAADTIKGCYKKSTGDLRVLKSGASCKSSELAISWNKDGPKGAAGAPGAKGADGAPGAKGDTGATGPQGEPGAKGADGAAGAKGDTGAAGANGDTGAAGANGDTGAAGAKGDTGATGATGPKGDTGATGPKGDNALVGGGAAFVDPAETTGYVGLTGAQNVAAAAAGAQGPVPFAGTLRNFRARLAAAAPSAVTLTAQVAGVDQPVTCTIASGATACADTTHSAVLAAGDLVDVKVTHAGGALRGLVWTAQLDAT